MMLQSLHTTPEDKAFKRELEARLRREKRWDSAKRYKEAQYAALRAAGEDFEAAVLASWHAVDREYPPLSPEELKVLDEERFRKQQEAGRRGGRRRQETAAQHEAAAEPEGQAEPAKAVASGNAAASSTEKRSERARLLAIPSHWVAIPDNAPLEKEADWVHANLAICRERLRTGDVMRLGRASTPAPSMGAVTMLEAAISNPNKFELDTYPKIKGKGGDDNADPGDEEEAKSINELEAILKRLREA